MFQRSVVTTMLACVVFLLGLAAEPLRAQNQGSGGAVSVTIASREDVTVLVASGNVTVSAGVVVTAQATYLKIDVPTDDQGKPKAGPVKSVKWKFYVDRNGNSKFDEGDSIVDHGTSSGPSLSQSYLLGNLTVNRVNDNQRLEYTVEGDKGTIVRDTALGGVL